MVAPAIHITVGLVDHNATCLELQETKEILQKYIDELWKHSLVTHKLKHKVQLKWWETKETW